MIENGEWTVVDASGNEVGRVDGDEYIRQGDALLYRIDGAEIYTAGDKGTLVAIIEGKIAREPDSEQVVFRFSGE